MVSSGYDPLIDHCTWWWDRLTLFGRTLDWSYCCYQHDVAFGELQDIWSSGAELAICVNGILPGMGVIMFFGVTSPIAMALWIRELLRKRRQTSSR